MQHHFHGSVRGNIQLRDALEEIREKAKIIRSTLRAICTAEESNPYEIGPYMEAIRGVAYWIYELEKDVRTAFDSLQEQQEAPDHTAE